MRLTVLIPVLVVAFIPGAPAPAVPAPDAWPAITRETRPWTYWWWMGSAVDHTNIRRELTRYRDAGLGGVHIIPIYDARGWESQGIPYLGPQWMEMLDFTVREADRLDLGVDMTTGSGWCFGGPHVTDAEANARLVVRTYDVPAGRPLPVALADTNLQAVAGFGPDGLAVDLGRPGAPPDTAAPRGPVRIYTVAQKPSGQRVKRAGPGGQGPMLNPFSAPAMRHYLEGFETAFKGYRGARPRAMYHDSYEYNSNWAPDLLEEFAVRRGYRLETELPALLDRDYPDPDRAARVKGDYRETLSDLMIGSTLPLWVRWSHRHGFLTRNEAHGSPGQLLDLYALADIPETEMFNRDRDRLVSRLASSAAHVAGRRLVAAETGTWLKEHFTGTLADMKYLLDDLYLSGVNHVFYHGTCYSPDEAGWPGWLFYASYEMNPRNPAWRDVPALNAYAARCQSILQSGEPDNDVLLYWPIHDTWHDPDGLERRFTVHTRDWIENQPLGLAARRLEDRGYAFDSISDRQLLATRTRSGRLRTGAGDHRLILVPRCARMPETTFSRLLTLARRGATVIFEEALPTDVPGWANLTARREERAAMLARLPAGTRTGATRTIPLGRGRLLVGDPEAGLEQAGVPRESMVDHPGLGFVRRRIRGGRHYFIANRGATTFAGRLPLAFPASGAVLLDPMTGRTRAVPVHPPAGHDAGSGGVQVRLAPGQSIILRALEQASGLHPPATVPAPPAPAESTGTSGRPDPVATGLHDFTVSPSPRWRVEFVAGGPDLPASYETERLGSWTALDDGAARRFGGTARYSTRFDAPPGATEGRWILDLGTVCQSARVRLNGRDLGTVFIPPFQVAVDRLEPKANQLEIEVTNLAANRIRDLDRRGVAWRTFTDINFVNLDYKPFDASNWPLMDSGLLGPVSLIAPPEPR